MSNNLLDYTTRPSAKSFDVSDTLYSEHIVHGAGYTDEGDIVLRLRSVDQARRAWRRASLQYATIVLTRLGYDGAVTALQTEIACI